MLRDILTVMWMERKGLMRIGGSRWRTIFTLLIPVIMIGIVLPIQFGRDLLSSAWVLIGAVFIPFMLVGMAIPASFAGERESHTLETLLASRLPDRAILLGKMGVAVAYGWFAVMIILLINVVVTNLVAWDGQIIFFDLGIAGISILLSLLVSLFVAALGVLVSLRAATVQGAQQGLMFILLIPIIGIQLIPVLLLGLIPNGREILGHIFENADLAQIMLVANAIILLFVIILTALAFRSFQRSRLIDS